MGFIANFILFLTVTEFQRSVKFWTTYSKLNLALFLGHSVDGLRQWYASEGHVHSVSQ